MPHSERIKSPYLRSTALCVASGDAVSGAAVLDGMLARKPKYAKISRMENVCQGAAIRRRGGCGGIGICACVGAMVAGLSFMHFPNRRYMKIWADTQARKEKLQPSGFAMDTALSVAHRHPVPATASAGSLFDFECRLGARSNRDPSPLRSSGGG